MLFLLLFLSDFNVKASPGMWIDYARTRQLSEERFLLQQQYGKKGEYDQGGLITILDSQGDALYDIPFENVWALKNGVFGDPDLFVYQNRDNDTWNLWHPDHDPKPIDGPQTLGRKNLKMMAVSQEGRIYFVNAFDDYYEIEEIRLSGDSTHDLFHSSNIPFEHLSYRINGHFELENGHNGLILWHSWLPSGKQARTFFQFSFDKDRRSALVNRDLGIGYSSLDAENGWFLMYKSGVGLILHDGERPRLVSRTGEQHPVDQAIRQFSEAFDRKQVFIEGQSLRYVFKGRLHELDLNTMSFKTYKLGGTWRNHDHFARPDTTKLFKINHQRFKVTKVDKLNNKQLVVVETLTIPDQYLADVALRPFTHLEDIRGIKEK